MGPHRDVRMPTDSEGLTEMGVRRAGSIIASTAVVTTFLMSVSMSPVQAARVCIPLLAGTKCVQFQEGRPAKPGLSKGMRIAITPTELKDGGDLTVTISGFAPNEGLRRFNYNIQGAKRMVDYSGEFRRADGSGRFTWIVSPPTTIYDPAWGRPALCVYGMRSTRLACAEFTVAPDTAAPAPAPAPPDAGGGTGSTNGGSQPAAPTPTPSTTGSCRDVGFTVLCTG